jgi:hypothetical protein
MTEPAGITVEMRVRSRLVEPERILPDHVVDAKSALRPEALKPKFTGFRVVARLGSPPRASCATANRASRPRRRLKPPVDLAEALRRAALSIRAHRCLSHFCPDLQSCRCWRRYECLKWVDLTCSPVGTPRAGIGATSPSGPAMVKDRNPLACAVPRSSEQGLLRSTSTRSGDPGRMAQWRRFRPSGADSSGCGRDRSRV